MLTENPVEGSATPPGLCAWWCNGRSFNFLSLIQRWSVLMLSLTPLPDMVHLLCAFKAASCLSTLPSLSWHWPSGQYKLFIFFSHFCLPLLKQPLPQLIYQNTTSHPNFQKNLLHHMPLLTGINLKMNLRWNSQEYPIWQTCLFRV